MNRTGTAIGQIPVYSGPDHIDFLYHWLRISWVELLAGRLLDESGDTCGHYLCSIRAIGYPTSHSLDRSKDRARVELETSVTALVHRPTEDSRLSPDAVFKLSEVVLTLALTFDVATDANGFLVTRAQLRPHSAEGAAVVQRYGGRTHPYVWLPDHR